MMADEQNALIELIRQAVREEINTRFDAVEYRLDEVNARLSKIEDILDGVVEQTARTMEDVIEIRKNFTQIAEHQQDQSLDIRLLKRVVVSDSQEQ